jgi:hypothetical protein
MKLLFALVISSAFFLLGCCGASTPSSSSSCPYGTYGSACTDFCSKMGNDENCFSDCMSLVRDEGLGDATTCCKSTIRQDCDAGCSQLESETHGDTTKAECMEECTATYSTYGIDLDTCALPY